MKKLLCLLLVVLMMSASSAFALNYTGNVGNEATFETLEEARANGPVFFHALNGRDYISDPCLDGYPEGTTFIYRSADMYGVTAAVRENTSFVVFAETAFATKDDAYAYIKGMGLIDIIDEARGSIVLITPANQTAFARADQSAYYKLQSAMFNVGGSVKNGDVTTYYSDGAYYGSFGYTYVIGTDGAATFLNNYIASYSDYVGRITGMLLINGKIDHVRNVAQPVPVYLVNATDAAVEKYKTANEANAISYDKAHTYFYNQAQPLQKIVLPDDASLTPAEYVQDAYYNLFVKAMRIPVRTQAVYASGAHSGYNLDESPYSLCERNAIIGGKTSDGIQVIRNYSTEQFNAFVTEKGEYLDTWYEFLPDEVLDNTAPAGTVPLWLACHGGGDDPMQFVNEIGLLKLAGEERFAIVAPAYQSLYSDSVVCGSAMVASVKMMLDKYPALDASRVYVTGYSMGGGTTVTSYMNDVKTFAAAVPMAGGSFKGTDEQLAALNQYGLPYMLVTSFYDPVAFSAADGIPKEMVGVNMNAYLKANKIDRTIDAFDYETYPISGFKADLFYQTTLGNEYTNQRWFFVNDEGAPMVGFCFTYDLIHALYPEYGYLAWDFVKHFSRDQATGEILYEANVD